MTEKIRASVGLKIVGRKSVYKDGKGKIVETRTGTFTRKFIDSIILIIEDDLAEKVIDVIAYDFDNLSRKCIRSGVWHNQALCLLGFMLYAERLKDTNFPPLSILAIDDGDIKPDEKEKRLKKLIKGSNWGEEIKNVQHKLPKLMLSFKLEYFDKEIKSLPEYNHKRWFEEINEESILSVNKLADKEKVQNLLSLIEFSKTITLTDCHSYYEELKKHPLKDRHNTSYIFHMIENFVLNSIKIYNNAKWEFYTNHIKEALNDINEENVKNFIAANVFFSRK